jgi:hypothetical protein
MTTTSQLISRHWFESGEQRLVVLLKRGRKWARVLDCGTLRTHKIAARDIDAHSVVVDVRPRKMATRLEKRRKQWKKLGMFSRRFSDKPVREAVRLLRERGVTL